MSSAAFNHAMMELAREAAGISQEKLAEEIGCTQATISRWEHGLFHPTDEDVTNLSKTLKVPSEFFFRPDHPLGGGLPVFYHRALVSAPGKVTAQVNARCFIRAMQIETLCKMSPPPAEEFPILHADGFADGAPAVAAALRATWRLKAGPIHNLVDLLESKGGIVIVEDLGCDEVDALCWWRPGLPKLFFVNARKPACRMRFSLAHELGHTIMHTEPTDPARAEREADEFAGEFLFPAKEARAAITPPITLARLASLKPWWKMSMAAIALRGRESGALTAEHLTALMKELGSRGWRKREPVEIPYEKPTRFARLLRFPLESLGYTREELAAALYTTLADLERMLGNNLVLNTGGQQDADRPWLRLVN